MNRHNVNRSIKKLIELGVILEGVKIGISRSYRLNPNFGGKAQPKAIGGSARALEGYQVIRGRRAHGAALATLPTCAHLSPDSQARLHRAGSVPCKPKTLKNEVPTAHFSLLRDPQGSCQHRGRCPHPFATWQGCRKPSCTLTTERWVASNPKAKTLRGCFASLDRFPAPSASVSFATPTEMEGSRATKSCILPLTP